MPEQYVGRQTLIRRYRSASIAMGFASALVVAGIACQSRQGRPHVATSSDDTPQILASNPLAGCALCHVDVEDTYVGSSHFKKKVGCTTCHGASEGHVADENNEVKPDQIFARADVDRLCGQCHDCDRSPEDEDTHASASTPRVCIDCHDHHQPARTAEARILTP